MSKSSNFYRAFEDRYRGSRELIRGRLEVYLDFLHPLAGLFKNPSAVDLGCGRGEFLEVLLAAGFKAKGVDLDAGMLKACEEMHLPAEKGDALAFLAKLPKQSQVVVSAFHVVEHIPFEQLQTLVSEAHRVLKPGGIMILETPNPENITVATANFYLDPTHQRPIPPPLLSFIGEYAGFERVKTLRLQESPELREKMDVNLADVLGGVSPDYSIVAQKAGSKKTMSALDKAFAKDYGLTSGDLANRYEQSHRKTVEQVGLAKTQADTELLAVRTALDAAQQELNEGKVALAAHQAREQEQLRHLEESKAAQEMLRQLAEERSASLASLQAKIELLSQDLSQARAEKEALGTDLVSKEAALVAEREAMRGELAGLTAKLGAMAEDFGAVRGEKESLAVKLGEREAALGAEYASKESALVAEREAMRGELAGLTAKLGAMAEDFGALRGEKESLAVKFGEREAALGAEYAAKESALVAERQAMREELSGLAAQLGLVAQELGVLRREKESLVERTKELASEVINRSAELESEVSKANDLSSRKAELEEELSKLSSTLEATKQELHHIHQANHQHWQLSEDLKKQLQEILDANHHHWQLAEQRQQRIDELLQSTCWRITAPLRWLRGDAPSAPSAPPEPLDRKLMKHAALYIRRRPKLKKEALKILFRNPDWHARVIPVVAELRKADALPSATASSAPPPEAQTIEPTPSKSQATATIELIANSPDLGGLTSQARRIYEQLSAAAATRR